MCREGCHVESQEVSSGVQARGGGHGQPAGYSTQPGRSVVFYPGNRWQLGELFDSSSAMARYAGDVASIASRPSRASQSVDMGALRDIAARFGANLKGGRSSVRNRLDAVRINVRHRRRIRPHNTVSGWLSILREPLLLRIRPARIWLTDLDESAEFSLIRGLETATLAREECDIEMSSEALLFAFQFLGVARLCRSTGDSGKFIRRDGLPCLTTCGQPAA